MRTQRVSLLVGLPVLALLAACGATSDAAGADDEVATLIDETVSTVLEADTADTADAADRSADEVALELSRCLRDEGLDVADIGVDADGNIDLRSAFDSVDRGDDSFRTAMDACRDVLDGVEFGAGRRAQFDDPAVQDAFLAFSDCIREQGFEDVPDLGVPTRGQGAPDADADGEQPDGPPPGAGEGRRDGDFGDRGSRMAEGLELDPDDPEVIAAIDACQPILDSVLGAGPGAAGATPSTESTP